MKKNLKTQTANRSVIHLQPRSFRSRASMTSDPNAFRSQNAKEPVCTFHHVTRKLEQLVVRVSLSG